MNRLPSLPRFNPATMSGIFPGTRPQYVWQLLVCPLAPGGDSAAGLAAEAKGDQGPQWAQLHWYETTSEEPAAAATLALFLHTEVLCTEGGAWRSSPLLTLDWAAAGSAAERDAEQPSIDVERVDTALVDALNLKLAAVGWQLLSCATCAHWRPRGKAGCCTWRATLVENGGQDDAYRASEPLTSQQPLALACLHWQAAPVACKRSVHTPSTTSAAGESKPGAADSAKRTLWQRVLSKWAGRPVDDAPGWRRQLLERLQGPGSISAGTEPCVACVGRSVNLGAWSGKNARGDAETWSVWRCNRCHTFYANRWIDRWVRLDSLETEETLVRIAPHEAFALLAQIVDGHSAGDGSASDACTAAFQQIFESRSPLAHQVKHGR